MCILTRTGAFTSMPAGDVFGSLPLPIAASSWRWPWLIAQQGAGV